MLQPVLPCYVSLFLGAPCVIGLVHQTVANADMITGHRYYDSWRQAAWYSDPYTLTP